ncbi:hypothetical protein JW916_11510 [Candidatus Sumerlaeota bacterium]|nr:hypothetical protein [Candidatus Sumerlaeota bacterium]
MSDEQTLLLVLVLLYLSDCLVWVRRGAAALVTHTGWGRFRIAGIEILSNHRGRAMALNPLSPLSTAFVCQGSPVSLSPDGACSHAAQGIDDLGPTGSEPVSVAPWKDAADTRTQSNDLLIGAERFARCSSRGLALSLARRISEIAGLPETEREEAIQGDLARALDSGRVAERIEETRNATRVLRPLCAVLFLFLFLVSPVAVWQHGFARAIVPLLVFGLPLHVAVLALFYRAHLRLHPAVREERWQHLVTMLLCPPMAARAADIVSRHALDLFHPIAVARALCDADDFAAFAKQLLLHLRYPLGAERLEPEARAVVEWSRETTVAAIETFLRDKEIDPEALCELRLPPDAAYRAYCPRCHSGFLRDDGECPDCPGVRLEPVEEGTRTGSAAAQGGENGSCTPTQGVAP